MILKLHKHFRSLKIASLLFCSIHICFSQDHIDYKKIKADELFGKGEQNIFVNKDSAYFYFNASYKISEKVDDWYNCIYALQGINYTSGYYFDLPTYKKTILLANTLFEKHHQYLDTIKDIQKLKNSLLIDKANYYSKIKDFEKIKEHAIQLRRKIEEKPEKIWETDDLECISIAYEYEAIANKQEGKYEIAEELYEKSLRITLNHLDEDFALPTYRLLGSLYAKQHKYNKANLYLKKKLNFEIDNGIKSRNKIIKSCYAIARNYIHLKKSDSTLYYLNLAQKQFLDNDPLEYEYYEIISDLSTTQQNYNDALQQLSTSIALFSKDTPSADIVEFSKLYRKQGNIYFKSGKYNEALNSSQLSLSKLSGNKELETNTENPQTENVYNKSELLRVLKDKSNVLYKLKRINKTLETSGLAISILDSLKPSFQDEDDKQLFIENSYPLYEIRMAAVYDEFKENKDYSYIKKAFNISEKSKSSILLEALLNAKAHQFSGIPEDLLETEKQLKANINYLERSIHKNPEYSKLKEELFNTKIAYQDLINQFETKYPKYYNLKYNNSVLSVESFKKEMNENSLAISYFEGNDALYAISVSKNETNFLKIPFKENYLKLISSLQESLKDSNSNIDSLKQISNALYNYILQPVLNNKTYSKLLIIPDGSLYHIPFEALYDGTNYLIEKSAISYANSATLLQQLKTKEDTNNKLLAFAPEFSDNDPLKLLPLPHNITEVNNIISHFNGTIYKNDSATLEAFKNESAQYGVLHLATHAIINDEQPEESFLAFSETNNEENLLFNNDIYNLNISASMVCLSACESGIGLLKKGEGMLSLSRAFFYAGASSIVNTKWKINDNSTSQIMKSFYNYLYKGKTKDKALQLAKLDFISKNKQNNLRHPYYWSGVVVSGDVVSINNHVNLTWLWIVFGLFSLGFLYFLLRRKKLIKFSQ